MRTTMRLARRATPARQLFRHLPTQCVSVESVCRRLVCANSTADASGYVLLDNRARFPAQAMRSGPDRGSQRNDNGLAVEVPTCVATQTKRDRSTWCGRLECHADIRIALPNNRHSWGCGGWLHPQGWPQLPHQIHFGKVAEILDTLSPTRVCCAQLCQFGIVL